MSTLKQGMLAALALLVLSSTTVANASTNIMQPSLPSPFEAKYKAKYSGFDVTATRSLKTLRDGSQEFRFQVKSWLADITEVSRFQWQENGQLAPLLYTYERDSIGSDRNSRLVFDHSNKTVSNINRRKPWSLPLQEPTLDKLSYQLQLQHDVSNNRSPLNYLVAEKGRIREYRFDITGEEKLRTSVGILNTVKVERVRDDDERSTWMWLAKDWDYLVVKIQHSEEDGQDYEINLTSALVGGKTVKGL